jgi:hypothetical protein
MFLDEKFRCAIVDAKVPECRMEHAERTRKDALSNH